MSKILVAYFSASGVTAKVAKNLGQALNADLYEICPKDPYTQADLDWTNHDSRSSVEMRDKNFRPPLADLSAPVAGHEVIFLGFPIWWYVAPTIINTFLEQYDFANKTIVMFATSGGSGFGKAKDGLQASAPNAKIIEGKVFSPQTDQATLAKWAQELGVL